MMRDSNLTYKVLLHWATTSHIDISTVFKNKCPGLQGLEFQYVRKKYFIFISIINFIFKMTLFIIRVPWAKRADLSRARMAKRPFAPFFLNLTFMHWVNVMVSHFATLFLFKSALFADGLASRYDYIISSL